MSDASTRLAGARITLLSLIPDAGHVIPLLRIGVQLRAAGAKVELICPSEALSLAQKSGIPSSAFGPVIPHAQRHHLTHLSQQSVLQQRIYGNDNFLKHYLWRVQENVFHQLEAVNSLVKQSRPQLLLADDHLFRRQYQWLAECSNVPLILHYSAGTRYLCAHRDAWTWVHGNAEEAAAALARLRGRVKLRLTRFLQPAIYSESRQRLIYLTEQWQRFDQPRRCKTLHIATGTAALEDTHCKAALDTSRLGEITALPPSPPLAGDDIDADLACWLDSNVGKPLLYVSFGTMVAPARSLCQKLAKAALAMGARVLWAGRAPPPAVKEAPPHLARSLDWAPQTRLLEHPAVTCFLSHGGAGALQEALWAGKPLLCVPFQWDQFYNARVVVTQLGVGLTIGRWASSRHIRQALKAALFDTKLRHRATALSADIRAISTERSAVGVVAELLASRTVADQAAHKDA